MREGRWKLVFNARDTDGGHFTGPDRYFLSDMSRDATERKNIAGEHADVRARLEHLHDEWLKDVGAQ